MDFELKTLSLAAACAAKADAVLVLVRARPAELDNPLAAMCADALDTGALKLAEGKQLHAYRVAGVMAPRVMLAASPSAAPKQVRALVQGATASLRQSGAKKLLIVLPGADGAQLGEIVAAAVAGAEEGGYLYTTTKPASEPATLKTVVLAVSDRAACVRAFDHATGIAAGVGLARELGNLPPNLATPTHLGEVAQTLAKSHGFACQVMGPKEVAKLAMGSFMSVAKGSEQPLRFIVLRYQGADAKTAPVVLVGKGITFDSGGISLKPGEGMDEMKFDMCGAASVLGTFRALADIRPSLNVVGLIAACENLPDGRAVKPGDVVTSMSGQTIEILNTDAEGRLILCDALTYAERFSPKSVVDVATLTGACVVALGAVRSGMYASNDELAVSLQTAGDRAMDLCWRMPLDDEYAEGLKSNFADVANIAGRAGGSVTAAKFLQRFAQKFPWGHLDIAGTAWKSGAAKGATGRPVGLLVHFLLGQSDPIATKSKPRVAKTAKV